MTLFQCVQLIAPISLSETTWTQSTFKKSTLPEKEKEKWNKVLISDFMSSEESDDESEDIIVVKPLVWRSERVTRFLQRLDEKCKDTKTTQAKRQRKQRVASNDTSVHPKPVVANLPSWAFCWATHHQCDDYNMLLHHSVILLIILFPSCDAAYEPLPSWHVQHLLYHFWLFNTLICKLHAYSYSRNHI